MIRNFFATILVVIAASFSQTAVATTEQSDSIAQNSAYLTLVDEADKACAEQRWTDALEALNSAMHLEPDNHGNILLMNNIGMIQHNLGMDTTAVATLSEAHRRAPSAVMILMNRAIVLTSMGQTDEALADYSLVMQLDSTEVNARFNHGLLSLHSRRYADAKKDFDYLSEHFPDSEESLIGNATMHCTMGEFDKAIPLYSSLIDKQEDDVEFIAARAYCRLQTGDLQEASDDIARALEMAPSDGELYLYRAALNKMRYRPEDARLDALKAVELGVDRRRVEQFVR